MYWLCILLVNELNIVYCFQLKKKLRGWDVNPVGDLKQEVYLPEIGEYNSMSCLLFKQIFG